MFLLYSKQTKLLLVAGYVVVGAAADAALEICNDLSLLAERVATIIMGNVTMILFLSLSSTPTRPTYSTARVAVAATHAQPIIIIEKMPFYFCGSRMRSLMMVIIMMMMIIIIRMMIRNEILSS